MGKLKDSELGPTYEVRIYRGSPRNYVETSPYYSAADSFAAASRLVEELLSQGHYTRRSRLRVVFLKVPSIGTERGGIVELGEGREVLEVKGSPSSVLKKLGRLNRTLRRQ